MTNIGLNKKFCKKKYKEPRRSLVIGFNKKFCKKKYINPESVSINGSSNITGILSGKVNIEVIINGTGTFQGTFQSPLKVNINGQGSLIGTLTAKGNLETTINGNSGILDDINLIEDFNVKISAVINGSSFVTGTLLSNEKSLEDCCYEVIYVDIKYIVKYCC